MRRRILAFDFGIDNLFNEQYFLFHPFPGRNFSFSPASTRSDGWGDVNGDKKANDMKKLSSIFALAGALGCDVRRNGSRRGHQGRRPCHQPGLEPGDAGRRKGCWRFLTIENKGTAPDKLVAVSAEIAGKAEVHEMTMDQWRDEDAPARQGACDRSRQDGGNSPPAVII